MKPEVLSQGQIAVVFKNVSCQCINVTLPNLNIRMEPTGFYSFADLVSNIAISTEKSCNPKRMIQVPTPCQGVDLHFRYEELIELQSILDSAILHLEISQIAEELS